MIALLSPAKTLDESPVQGLSTTQTRMQDKSMLLIKKLRPMSVGAVQELMSISEKLAVLNVNRFKAYSDTFSDENAKAAVLMFKGDVYTGLEASDFSEKEMAFAQGHVRILSGLYGLLRPLDLMQAYRLEMGSKLKIGSYKNLYNFWGDTITKLINDDLNNTEGNTVVNLASKEYFKAVNEDKLDGKLINIHFKEDRKGQLKVISFNAKKARGKMTQLIVKERVTNAQELKSLVANDYIFNTSLSTDKDWLFVKE